MVTRNLGFFVVGTDTEIGKTYVTSLLAKAFLDLGRTVGVYKPVASGCRIDASGQLVSDDAVALWHAAGKPRTLEEVTPQRFEAALAPNVAARLEGKFVDGQRIRKGLDVWRDFEVVLVEGLGGLMSPVSDEELVIDIAADFALPLVLVVGNRLGCINSTLLSLAAARERNLPIAGVYLNDFHETDRSGDTNQAEIERLANVDFVRRVRFNAQSIDISGLR